MKTKWKRWHLQIGAFLRIDNLLRCLLDSFFVTYIYIHIPLSVSAHNSNKYFYLYICFRAVARCTPIRQCRARKIKVDNAWPPSLSQSLVFPFFFLDSITLFLRICRAISSRISLNRLGLSYDWLFFFFCLLLPPPLFFKGPFVFFLGGPNAHVFMFFFFKFLSQHFRLQLYVP